MSQSVDDRQRHLFWVVAKDGGMPRAARRLGMAVQAMGTPVRALERAVDTANAALWPLLDPWSERAGVLPHVQRRVGSR